MKKVIFYLFVSVFSITTFANQYETEEELREKVDDLNKKFVKSIMESNMETYLSMYTDDATIMMPFLAPINGKHALTTYWHNRMAKGEVIDDVSVVILDIWSSDKFVYERGSYQITYKIHQNNIKAIHGSYFTVWEKQKDGSLKIKYDIANLDHGV